MTGAVTPAVTGLLLAAGNASRFGANKILACLPYGEAIGLAAARRLRPAVDRLLVVVRAAADDTARAFAAADYEVLACAEAELGMAHSLACGVRASSASAGWVVALADMPYVETATVDALVRCFRQCDGIVVPRHAGVAGHPVIFPARHGAELAALTGDRGARALLAAHAQAVQYLDTADGGVLRDIDRPDDVL